MLTRHTLICWILRYLSCEEIWFGKEVLPLPLKSYGLVKKFFSSEVFVDWHEPPTQMLNGEATHLR